MLREEKTGKNEYALLILFLILIPGSFVLKDVYEAIAPFGTLIFFFGLILIYFMSTGFSLKPVIKKDFVSLSGIAAVIIAPANLLILSSGLGAMFIIFDLVLLLTLVIRRSLSLSGRMKRILSFLTAALMLFWYPVIRWDFGFNMVGLVFLILLIFGELIMEYVKNDMELPYLKYVQILFFFTSVLLAICYQARSAALSMAVFGIAFLLMPFIAEKKPLKYIWILIFTLGSIGFTLILPLMGQKGWNLRILYKDTLSGRELIWAELWSEFLKRPLTGIGSSYQMKSFFMFEVHNGLFDILTVHGILVFICIFYLLFKALKSLFSRDLIFCADKRIAFSGIYALLFASFFENCFIVTPYSLVFFILLLITV